MQSMNGEFVFDRGAHFQGFQNECACFEFVTIQCGYIIKNISTQKNINKRILFTLSMYILILDMYIVVNSYEYFFCRSLL